MLELIDQSNPQQLRYRCERCHVTGVSIPSQANPDNCFLVMTPGGPKPYAWVRHVCTVQAPIAPVVEEAPKVVRKRRAKVAPTP